MTFLFRRKEIWSLQVDDSVSSISCDSNGNIVATLASGSIAVAQVTSVCLRVNVKNLSIEEDCFSLTHPVNPSSHKASGKVTNVFVYPLFAFSHCNNAFVVTTHRIPFCLSIKLKSFKSLKRWVFKLNCILLSIEWLERNSGSLAVNLLWKFFVSRLFSKC